MKTADQSAVETWPCIPLSHGPSKILPDVLRTMSQPLVSHRHPELIRIIEYIPPLFRYTFQKWNYLNISVFQKCSAEMAYAFWSCIAIVEKMMIGVNEYFGESQVRITERFRACGGRVDRSFGDIFSPEEIKTAVQGQDLERMGIFRVGTSTGTYQAQEKRCCTICGPAGFHDGVLRF